MQTKKIKQYSTFVFALAFTVFTIFLSSCGDDPAPAPVADFTYVVDEATGLKVTFTNTSVNGVSYEWSFGVTGATSTVESPEYTYTKSGAYLVTLTATNVDGAIATKSQTLAITAIPQNLLVNGKFVNNANWTLSDADLSDDGTWTGAAKLTFNNGLTISANYVGTDGGATRSLFNVYQQIKLEPGTYKIRTDVAITNLVNDCWFFMSIIDFALDPTVGETIPEDDEDGANQVFSTDFGAGCTTFTGDLSKLPCLNDRNGSPGVKADGTFQISTAGTYYFVLTAGQWEASFGDFKIKEVGIYKEL